MEIIFEPEDTDLSIKFEPDFDLPLNCVDIEGIRWDFQNGTHTRTMASLLGGTPEYEYTSTHLPQTVRLCDRRNEDGV